MLFAFLLAAGAVWTRSAIAPIVIAQHSTVTAPDSCAASIGRQDTLRTPDGRIVSLNALSGDARGGVQALTGTPTYVWPPEEKGLRVQSDSLIGILLSGGSRVVGIPRPSAISHALYPRIVPGARGWDAVLFEVPDWSNPSTTVEPTVKIWYGHFDGRVWTMSETIGTFHAVNLLPGAASQLVRVHGELALAIPFDRTWVDKSNASGEQGVILVHGHPGAWQSDTLKTPFGPQSVELLPDESAGSMQIIFAQSYFDAHWVPQQAEIFRSVWSGQWSEPVQLTSSSQSIQQLRAISVGGGATVLSWYYGYPDRPSELLTMTMGRDGITSKPVIVATDVQGYSVVTVGRTGALWAIPVPKKRSVIRLFSSSAERLRSAGTLSLPSDSFFPFLYQPSSTEFSILTEAATGPSKWPPAITVLSTVTVHCAPTRPSAGAGRPPISNDRR